MYDITFVVFLLLATGFDYPFDAAEQILEGIRFCHEQIPSADSHLLFCSYITDNQ